MSNHPVQPDQDYQPAPDEDLVPEKIGSDLSSEQSRAEYVARPEVEPDVRSLILCQASPLLSDSLESFSSWLQIPKSCLYLATICSTLERHLDNVKAIALIEEDSLPVFVVDGLTTLTDILQANRDDWSVRNCRSRSKRLPDPTYSIQTESPFYAAIPYPANIKDETAQHHQVTAHLIFAAIQAWDNDSKQYRHGTFGLLKDASLAVRKLSKSACIALLLDGCCNISTYRAALNLAIETKGTPEITISEKDIKHLKAILDLLTAFDGEDDEEITEELEWKSLPPDFTDSDSFINYATHITATKAELREVRKSGLAISEVSADVEYVIWDTNETEVKPDHPQRQRNFFSVKVPRRFHWDGSLSLSG